MKTVIAPVDFSPVTNRVADAAIALARLLKGRVVLLHVTPPPAPIRDLLPAVETVAQRRISAGHQAEKKLNELKHEFVRRFHAIEVLALSGPPVSGIVEEAQKSGADYIVIGSHGHSAAYDALMGSVASGVVKKAPCPVLIIPAIPVSTSPVREGSRMVATA